MYFIHNFICDVFQSKPVADTLQERLKKTNFIPSFCCMRLPNGCMHVENNFVVYGQLSQT